MNDTRYTINQLCEKTGFSRRNIRYYVEIGLIGRPKGRGRGGFYNDSHLLTLLEVKQLQDKGLRLSAIIEYLKKGAVSETRIAAKAQLVPFGREVWVQYEISPGVVLSVRRDIEEQSNRKVSEIVRLAKTVIQEGEENE